MRQTKIAAVPELGGILIAVISLYGHILFYFRISRTVTVLGGILDRVGLGLTVRLGLGLTVRLGLGLTVRLGLGFTVRLRLGLTLRLA